MGINLTLKAHELAENFFAESKPMYVVDATLGNGHDALFLANLMKKDGKLFAFDVQESALESSRDLFQKNKVEVKFEFFLQGHENLEKSLPDCVNGKVGCVFFNLGWLPRSDKKISTQPNTTLKALALAKKVLDKNCGYLSVLCYRGHDGGTDEYVEVLKFFNENFGDKFLKICDENNEKSPVLLAIGFKENKF